MNQVLFIESSPKIEFIYRLNYLTWLDLNCHCESEITKAINYLQTNSKDIKLIALRYQKGRNDIPGDFLKLYKTLNLKIPCLLIGKGPKIKEVDEQIENALDLKAIIRASAQLTKTTAQEMMNKNIPELFSLRIEFFDVLKVTPCNVYRLENNQEDLIFAKNQSFTQEEIQKLKNEKTDSLYVDKLDRLEMVNTITKEYISIMDWTELSDDEALKANEQSVELLSEKLKTVGINEETISLAKKNIEGIKRNLRSNPKLSKLLERLLKNQSSYLFKHTQILTFVGLHIIKNIDWGTPEQEDKISFIAFFHDIALETDAQAKIKSNIELKKSTLTPREKQLVEKHAQISSELISKFPHAPMGVDQIIRQHHGSLNGLGFADHFGANISPMAIVLIIAEEFTRQIIDSPQEVINKTPIITSLKTQFTSSRFKKTIDLLENITL